MPPWIFWVKQGLGLVGGRRGVNHVMSQRALLTTIPVDLNGMIHVRFGHNETLLHMWNKVPARVTTKRFFI